jgi:putative transposase
VQPVEDAVVDRWGRRDADVARGLALRHDGDPGPLGHFTGSSSWLGIADDAAFLGEPEANGCAERWIRTPKQQCSWAESHDAIDQLRQAVAGFVDRYDSSWLIGRHGHQTPKEAPSGSSSDRSGMTKLARHPSKKPGAVQNVLLEHA